MPSNRKIKSKMGDTAVSRFGYGVKITDGPDRDIDKYDDLEFFLAEKYPLLEDGSAGNAWVGEMETWVFVKSTMATEYGYRVIKLNRSNFIVPVQGLAELERFIRETPLTVGEPQWVVLTSLG